MAVLITMLGVGLIVLGALYWLKSRGDEIFVVKVMGVRARVVRGDLPNALLGDILDVVQQAGISECTVRCVRGTAGARVQLRPGDDAVEQRLRNLVHTSTLGRYRATRDVNLDESRGFVGNIARSIAATWVVRQLFRR